MLSLKNEVEFYLAIGTFYDRVCRLWQPQAIEEKVRLHHRQGNEVIEAAWLV